MHAPCMAVTGAETAVPLHVSSEYTERTAEHDPGDREHVHGVQLVSLSASA